MNTNINYKSAREWIIKEDRFDSSLLGKTESIMCQGNGYMGIRAAAEERYLNETRDCFVAGTFNKADWKEVTELPNAADILNMEIYLNGERFNLETGQLEFYEKSLNLQNGELKREISWSSPKGLRYRIDFARFISMDNYHLIGQRISIIPMDDETVVHMQFGIDGTRTNSGAQHFDETEKRCYDNHNLQYVQTTVDSKITFVQNTSNRVFLNELQINAKVEIGMARRRVFCDYDIMVPKESSLTIEKFSTIHTTRDWDYNLNSVLELQEKTLAELEKISQEGYECLFTKSSEKWKEYWNDADIQIQSDNDMDQLAIRFAQYHLRIMTPFHDERLNVGAKGLSGEGYKGHTFWDTELFILPYYNFQFPETAKKLLMNRYLGLDGARKKAFENGYKGAQYPWEAAWIQDGEVTPPYGDVDIKTGMPQKIWTGQIEQHITADIIYGLWQYYQISDNKAFMEEAGYKMIFETAMFWASRLEKGEDDRYHIKDVIGPDEYKEHVNDNAFTNYMACWNLEKAIEGYDYIKAHNTKLWKYLDDILNLQVNYIEWKNCVKKIYLPQPRLDGVIPQDATYLEHRVINLEKYKKQDFVLGIYRDYNAEQINKIQVSKQADVLILFFLLENYFTQEIKIANWNYYEPKTLHDSSLSLSTHCILANDIGDNKMAYELFERLYKTDLGPNMKSSDGGIHAAACGGIWQSVIFGFAGLRLLEDDLRIRPNLPTHWKFIEFHIWWKGVRLKIRIEQDKISIKPMKSFNHEESIEICGTKYNLNGDLRINYS